MKKLIFSIMLFCSIALHAGLSSTSLAATITGSVLYNEETVNVYVGETPVQFWVRNEDTGQVASFTSDYDHVSSSIYHIYDLPAGRYGIQTYIPAATPYGFFPGNYYGWYSSIRISYESEIVYQNLSVNKLIHLVSPVDNDISTPLYDTYSLGALQFKWMPIAEAEYYEFYVEEFQYSPYSFIKLIQHSVAHETSAQIFLSPNSVNRHYQFRLYAYNSDKDRVGQMMIVFPGGCAWDYRFIVTGATPESITQDILNLDDSAFKNESANRKSSLEEKLDEVQELIGQGFYQTALDKLIKDIRPKMDGCYGGNPYNDWITDCPTQEQLLAMVDDLIKYVQDLI